MWLASACPSPRETSCTPSGCTARRPASTCTRRRRRSRRTCRWGGEGGATGDASRSLAPLRLTFLTPTGHVRASPMSVNGRGSPRRHGGTEKTRETEVFPARNARSRSPIQVLKRGLLGASYGCLFRTFAASPHAKHRLDSTLLRDLRASVVNPSEFRRRRFECTHPGHCSGDRTPPARSHPRVNRSPDFRSRSLTHTRP